MARLIIIVVQIVLQITINKGGKMSKKLKTYRVVLSYDVQKTFMVDAKNYDEAYDKAFDWKGDTNKDNWEYRDHIETEEEK
jgi:hypothetical protein|tara:strand:+ start:937 stop:1179 length:243 start_codon:yes stop_codon:yes gene_type:complete